MKKVYDTTRLLSGRRTTQSKLVKNTNRVVDDQLNQWKGYFQDVLNRPAPENPAILTDC